MRKGLIALSATLAIASCDDVNLHILSGQLYDPINACVQPSAGIDVVPGEATGDACDPVCLTATSGTSSFVYVTTMCPPYPVDYTTESQAAATDPSDPCTGAFAAYNAGTICAPATAGGGCAEGGTTGDDSGGMATGDDSGGSSGCASSEAGGDDGSGGTGDDGGGDAGDDGGGTTDALTE
jgi:hypothetical protein